MSEHEESEDEFNFSESGLDLSHYNHQLERERQYLSLNLRQGSFISSPPKNSWASVVINDKYPQLNPNFIVKILQDVDMDKVKEILDILISGGQEISKYVKILGVSQELEEELVNILGKELTPGNYVVILNIILILFPISGELMEKYSDDGLPIQLLGFLSSNNVELITATIMLITTLSKCSEYARDALLCYGIHTTLIDLANSSESIEFAEICCDGILGLFQNESPIEPSVIQEMIPPLTSLLQLPSTKAVISVINAFVEITNELPNAAFDLFQYNIYHNAIQMLNDPQLCRAALHLIGNVSNVPFVENLIQSGLGSALMEHINEYTAEIFWILSNILEYDARLIAPYLDDAFLGTVIEISLSSSYDVKKEAAFFLSTRILTDSTSNLEKYCTADVANLFIDIISCGEQTIIQRCIDAALRLVLFPENHEIGANFAELLHEADVDGHLSLLETNNSLVLSDRAKCLQLQIDCHPLVSV